MQLKAAELALTSLQQAVTTAPELYGLPKQMQQLLKVNSLLCKLLWYSVRDLLYRELFLFPQ